MKETFNYKCHYCNLDFKSRIPHPDRCGICGRRNWFVASKKNDQTRVINLGLVRGTLGVDVIALDFVRKHNMNFTHAFRVNTAVLNSRWHFLEEEGEYGYKNSAYCHSCSADDAVEVVELSEIKTSAVCKNCQRKVIDKGSKPSMTEDEWKELSDLRYRESCKRRGALPPGSVYRKRDEAWLRDDFRKKRPSPTEIKERE